MITTLKILLKSIDEMKLLLKFLNGEKMIIINGDEETVIDGNDMTEIKSELKRKVESTRKFIESNISLFLYDRDQARRKTFPFPPVKTNEEIEAKLALLKSDLFDGEIYSKETINKLEELKQTMIDIRNDLVSQIPDNLPYKADL